MANEKLKIGIIGAGSIVRQRHMPGLAAIEEVEVVAVCNRHSMTARAFAEEFKIPRVAYDWHEIVGMPEVDIIWIGTTPYLHREIAVAALNAGKHVFCQSRMCMNLDEARQIAAAAAEHPDRVLRFCPPPMGMAGDRTMRRLLQQERFVGDVRQVTLTSVSGILLDPQTPLGWRLQKEQSGQNVLTVGIYLEVLERWLGPISRVTAVNRTWTAQRPHPETGVPTPAEIPESVNVIADYPGGAVGVFLFNGVSSHGPSDHLAVHGTEGTLVYDFNADENLEQIEGAKRGEETMARIDIPDNERRTWTVEADFIRTVRGLPGDDILPDVRAGLSYMAVLDAIYRSAGTHRTVDVIV